MDIGKYHIEPLEFPEVKTKRTHIHHLWLFDRSGSMTQIIRGVVSIIQDNVKKIPEGDFLSLGWFSGEGHSEIFVVKVKVDATTRPQIITALEKIKFTLNTTCFSEILGKAIPLSTSYGEELPISLMFFTDGYPVVTNTQKEWEAIHKNLGALSYLVRYALIVGCGYYYNRENIVVMAKSVGGMASHTSYDMTGFISAFDEFSDQVCGVGMAIRDIGLGYYPDFILEYNGRFVNACDFSSTTNTSDPENRILVSTTPGFKCFAVCEIVGDLYHDKSLETENDVVMIYALARYLFGVGDISRVADLMSALGDINIVDMISNAFTNDEYGNVSTKLEMCMVSPGARFSKGRETAYAGNRGTGICILEIIDILSSDESATMFPWHSDFEYNRIGVKSIYKEGYPKFIEADESFSFAVVYEETRLNVSLRLTIPGYCDLTNFIPGMGRLGTRQYRTYTIIKDGNLNVKTLCVRMSDETVAKLKDRGVRLVTDNVEGCWIIVLEGTPVVNRDYAKPISAEYMCRRKFDELNYMAQQKVVNHILKLENKIVSTEFSIEQNEKLKELGFSEGGYNPPSEKEESKDWYDAYEMDISIKGMSSLPGIEAVIAKMNSPMTPRENLIYKYLQTFYGQDGVLKYSDSECINRAKILKRSISKLLGALRVEMARDRFSVLLCKSGFTDLPITGGTITVDGNEFTVKIKQSRFPY